MKTMLFTVLVSLSLNVFAQTENQPSSEQSSIFGAIFMLKSIVSNAAEDTTTLINTVSENKKAYAALGYFQFTSRVQVAQQNCAEIDASVVAHVLMITSWAEQMGKSLQSVPEFNNDVALNELMKITGYIKELKKASDKCSDPAESLKYVQRASALINEANTFLEKIELQFPQ